MALTSISVVLDDGTALTFSAAELAKVKDPAILKALGDIEPPKPSTSKETT